MSDTSGNLQARQAGAGAVDSAWLDTSDELLTSINHALSNRLAALISLVRVMEFGGSQVEALLPMLQQEVDRLEGTTALLRVLPRAPLDQPEPVRLRDLLPDVLALQALQRDGRELPVEFDRQLDCAPVWAPPIVLTHALLMLFRVVTGVAARAGAARISARLGGDEERATLTVEVHGNDVASVWTREAGGAEGTPPVMAAAEQVLRSIGGSLSVGVHDVAPGSLRLAVALPTLLAVRRSMRAGERG